MRRFAAFACLAFALPALAMPAEAAPQGSTRHSRPSAPASKAESKPESRAEQPGQPPHAWLFGTWTGGLFPAPSEVTSEACLAQPVVIFTRDIVLRASLTDQFYAQRAVETVLTTTSGTQFRFAALPGGSPASAGFGCSDPDALTVERKADNQISFPNCGDFPNPLVRCPSR